MKRNFARVVVYVEDCNDHSPIFLSPRFEAILSNMAATGSQVIQVKALDKDTGSNADITYSLHSGERRPLCWVAVGLVFSVPTPVSFNFCHLQ